ncbi:MAG TPA: 7TM diverse intracellular signaling domain-containing protein [Sediminibacterium sp.]
MRCKLILWCLLCLPVPALFAQDTLVIGQGDEQVLLGRYLGLLEDPAGQLGIHRVMAGAASLPFVAAQEDVPVLAGRETYVWARFFIRNNTGKDLWLGIGNAVTDTVLFYQVFHDSVVAAKMSGDKVPFAQRDLASNKLFFRILNRPETQTIYLRLNIRLPRQFPLYVCNSNAFIETQGRGFFINGIFYGLLVVIVLYNLFVWFMIRDVAYIHYIFYILFTGLVLMHFDGITYAYLWPSHPWLNDQPALLSSIPMFFALAFAANFLGLRNTFPLLLKGLWLLGGWLLLACIMSLSGFKFAALSVSQLCSFVAAIYFMITGALVYRTGYIPARYFLASWTVLIAGLLVFLAKDMGWVRYNTFTANALKLGVAAEAVLIAFALADKINFYKREHHRALNEKKHLQAELAGFTEHLKQKNTLIEKFRQDMAALEQQLNGNTEAARERQADIEKLLQSIILTEDDWIAFRKLFDKVYAGYIFRLKEKYPQLTDSDLRLITLMKLQLNYREMSNMLGVTTEAVRKSKQRLRKKLGLTEEELVEELIAFM